MILFLLWLFLLILPKGGVKIGNVPLTWGYFLIVLVSIYSLFRPRFTFQIERVQAYLCTLPFQVICLLTFFIYGIDDINFGISFIFSFFFLPLFFYLLLSEYTDEIDLNFLFKLIKTGVFLIASYGIILFLIKIKTGLFIEIPFLTTNYHDYGEIAAKHIDRGSVFKLISTYNNGNIYGICLLMLYPLYQFLEKRAWRRWIVVTSLILSFSRTVWAGLIFSEVIIAIFTKKISLLPKIIISCLAIISITFYFGFDFTFLFDRTLGGRIDHLKILETATLFPDKPFGAIHEIVYLGILFNFGIIGLIGYLIAVIGPIFIALSFKISQEYKMILSGLINYHFLCLSDGALLFIPVLVFYWFLSSLLLQRECRCIV